MSQFVFNHVVFRCWIVWAVCCCCLVAKSCLTFSFVTPRIIAHQVPLSLGFPSQEYWRGLPFPTPRDWTCISCIGRSILYHCTTWEAPLSSISSVQFCRPVMSDSLWPHGLQHARLPCPSPTPRAYSSSCPLSQWCHPTISSSLIPFSFHPQSFHTSRSFQMSRFSASGGQGKDS